MMYSKAVRALPALGSGYVPPGEGHVKLNQNESPFDLDPEEKALLLEELKAVPLNRYPDPRNGPLVERIAPAAGVAADGVLVGSRP
jgi:histidinol-phosphate/aromatic aminotransferase/cobyric acid decarboxylase-like protein